MNSTGHANPASPLDVLLLPGLMCDHAFWQPLLDAPPAGYRCQVVDYGDADSLGAMARCALANAPPRFALAGHSMGGRVAMELLRQAPQRVESLILMDTGYLALAAGEVGEKERAGRLALVELARNEGVGVMAADWVEGMVHPSRLNAPALLGQIIDMFERKSAERFARQQDALLGRPDASAVLSSLGALGIPALLLCGRQDSWANLAQHQAMLALAPRAGLTVIEDSGHMVLMEKPKPTLDAITSFLLQTRR